MDHALAHRGPNRADQWLSGSIGLGRRTLFTTPEPCHGELPFPNPAQRYVVVADARIDNRDELLSSLGIARTSAATIGDSRLILAAFERWGERCLERLLGDWAFAIWDQHRHTLFCARDRMGIKPFYYHYTPGRCLVFASEIKAFWQLADVPRRVNEASIGDYLLQTYEDRQSTFYEGIHRLSPAHSMLVGDHGMRLAAYWTLDPERELPIASDAAYVESFRELLTEAVRCRTRSVEPVGSLLSGGLDSSSITCLAQAQVADALPLHTFSATFADVPQSDERPYIDAVLGQGRYNPHVVRGDQIGPFADWERMLAHQDKPFSSPNLFIHWALYRAAEQNGVRVLLDGFDGDTTVSHGIAYLTELANSLRWIALFQEIQGLSRRFAQPLPRMLWRYGVRRLRLEPARTLWNTVRRSGISVPQRDPLIEPEFWDHMRLAERYQLLEASRSLPPQTERADHLRRLSWGLVPYVCEVLDHAAAAWGVEPRYPFFDRRLVEFCLALPPRQKIQAGWTRLILRRAMEGILPTEVQWRGGKSDPGPNFVRGLLLFHRDLLDEIVLGEAGRLDTYIDHTILRSAYENLLAHHQNGDALVVWRGVMLALWLRMQ